TGLVYWVARLRKVGREAAIRSVLRLSLWPACLAATAPALPLLASAPLFERPGLGRLVASFLPASVALEARMAAARGYRLMGRTVLVDKVGRTLAQLAALGAIAATGTASASTVTAAWALPYLPAAFTAAWCLRRRHRGTGDAGFPDRVQPRAFWGFTAPRAIAGVAQ